MIEQFLIGVERYIGQEQEWCHVGEEGKLTYVSDNDTVIRLKKMYWVNYYSRHLKYLEGLEGMQKNKKEEEVRSELKREKKQKKEN